MVPNLAPTGPHKDQNSRLGGTNGGDNFVPTSRHRSFILTGQTGAGGVGIFLRAIGQSRGLQESLEEFFAISKDKGYANLAVIDTNSEFVANAVLLARRGNRGDRALVRRILRTRAFAAGGCLSGMARSRSNVIFGCLVLDDPGRVQTIVMGWVGLD